MEIHAIHDLSNQRISEILKKNFSLITDKNIIKNYHPDYETTPGNIFFILKEGRYSLGKGKYFVITEGKDFVSSAGWNEYELDASIALLLTRMYVDPKYRTSYVVGKNVLPLCITESNKYTNQWITFNEYNIAGYNWFVRAALNKTPALVKGWPDIYKGFKPIGKREVYFTTQSVVALGK